MQLMCSVCTEVIKEGDHIYATPCGHVYHLQCLIPWVIESQTCPQCRKPVPERSILRIYPTVAGTGVSEAEHTLKQENDTLKTENQSLNEEADAVKVELLLAKETIANLEQQLGTSRRESDRLKNEVQELATNFERAVETLQSWRQTLETSSRTVTNLEGQITGLNSKICSMKETIEVLRERIQKFVSAACFDKKLKKPRLVVDSEITIYEHESQKAIKIVDKMARFLVALQRKISQNGFAHEIKQKLMAVQMDQREDVITIERHAKCGETERWYSDRSFYRSQLYHGEIRDIWNEVFFSDNVDRTPETVAEVLANFIVIPTSASVLLNEAELSNASVLSSDVALSSKEALMSSAVLSSYDKPTSKAPPSSKVVTLTPVVLSSENKSTSKATPPIEAMPPTVTVLSSEDQPTSKTTPPSEAMPLTVTVISSEDKPTSKATSPSKVVSLTAVVPSSKDKPLNKAISSSEIESLSKCTLPSEAVLSLSSETMLSSAAALSSEAALLSTIMISNKSELSNELTPVSKDVPLSEAASSNKDALPSEISNKAITLQGSELSSKVAPTIVAPSNKTGISNETIPLQYSVVPITSTPVSIAHNADLTVPDSIKTVTKVVSSIPNPVFVESHKEMTAPKVVLRHSIPTPRPRSTHIMRDNHTAAAILCQAMKTSVQTMSSTLEALPSVNKSPKTVTTPVPTPRPRSIRPAQNDKLLVSIPNKFESVRIAIDSVISKSNAETATTKEVTSKTESTALEVVATFPEATSNKIEEFATKSETVSTTCKAVTAPLQIVSTNLEAAHTALGAELLKPEEVITAKVAPTETAGESVITSAGASSSSDAIVTASTEAKLTTCEAVTTLSIVLPTNTEVLPTRPEEIPTTYQRVDCSLEAASMNAGADPTDNKVIVTTPDEVTTSPEEMPKNNIVTAKDTVAISTMLTSPRAMVAKLDSEPDTSEAFKMSLEAVATKSEEVPTKLRGRRGRKQNRKKQRKS